MISIPMNIVPIRVVVLKVVALAKLWNSMPEGQ